MKVKIEELIVLTKKAILNYGYDEQEAQAIERVLLYAQFRGNNQGVVKLIGPGIPKSPDAVEMEIERETKLSALINGHQNHAMVVVHRATDLAIRKAKEHGMGLVGVNHVNTSSGAIGYYAREIARQGLIGFVFAGSAERVAAAGSYEPIFGTNPLAIALPTEQEPLVLDMATAAMAYYGVIEARTAGRPLPEGIAYDSEGNLTTDPAKALTGALHTFDKSHRGSGLSMMVQALTGPLVGASFTGIGDVANNWGGHFVLAIDPELLGGLQAVRQGVSQMVKKVKATQKLPGVEDILVPGERGDRLTQQVLSEGEVEIEDNLYHELIKAGEK
jgi:L-2-hydroxycarboxylate dehydrogenase (NAD+)